MSASQKEHMMSELKIYCELYEQHFPLKLHPFQKDEYWTYDKYCTYIIEQSELSQKGDLNASAILLESLKFSVCFFGFCNSVCCK